MFDVIRKTALALALGSALIACGGPEEGLEAEPQEVADDALILLPVYTRIAYTSGYDVRIVRNDGAQDELLIAGARSPAFSEGRQRLAYVQGNAIKVINAPFDAAALSNAITIYSGTGVDAPASLDLSADGTLVIFATAGLAGYGADVKRSVVGSGVVNTVIDNNSTWVFSPTFFSRDAVGMAYNQGTPSVTNGLVVRTMSPFSHMANPTGGNLLVTQAYAPNFRLSGNKMVFHRWVNGRGYDLFTADTNGQNVTAWEGNSDEDDMDATFSGAGGVIAFSSKRTFLRCNETTQLCQIRNSNNLATNLVTGNLSASNIDVLTNHSGSANSLGSPSWR